jgi:hypothetical protein
LDYSHLWDKRNGQTFIRQKLSASSFFSPELLPRSAQLLLLIIPRPLHAGERRERERTIQAKNTEAPAIGIPQCFSNPTAALFIGF